MNRALSRCWNRYEEWWESERYRKGVAHRAMTRLLNRPLSHAWNTWRSEQRRQQRALRAVRQGMSPIGKAWRCWLQQMSLWYRLRKFARRMLHRSISRAWERWFDSLPPHARLRKFTRRMRNKPILKGWNQWTAVWLKATQLRRLARRVVNRGVARALRHWQNVHAELVRLRTFGRRMIKRNLAKALRSWMELSADRQRMISALRRMRTRSMSKCLNQWADVVSGGRRRLRRLRGFANKMKQHALTRATNKLAALGRARRKALTVARRLSLRAVVRSVNAWRENTTSAKRLQSLVFQAAGRLQNREIARGFNRWTARVQSLVPNPASRSSPPYSPSPPSSPRPSLRDFKPSWGCVVEPATTNPAMGKFVDDAGTSSIDHEPGKPAFVLSYGDMHDFQRGLTGLVGPPEMGNALEVMRADHSDRSDSLEWFSVGNYGTTTTSEIEFLFVVEPTEASLETLGLERWPSETRLENAGGEYLERMRKLIALEQFEPQRRLMHTKVKEHGGASFTVEALIGGRLYTGPMFVKYNAVLRGKQRNAPEFAIGRMHGLCGAPPETNLYTTTLHVINTALVALSCCTKITKVYRGMSGGAMPEQFHDADEFGLRGGVELGCMSTTDDQRVAFEYAAGDFGLVMEIAQSVNARGAMFDWLSQYPHECEITFPPLTVLEVTGTRTDESGTQVYELRPIISRATEVDALKIAEAATTHDGRLKIPTGLEFNVEQRGNMACFRLDKVKATGSELHHVAFGKWRRYVGFAAAQRAKGLEDEPAEDDLGAGKFWKGLEDEPAKDELGAGRSAELSAREAWHRADVAPMVTADAKMLAALSGEVGRLRNELARTRHELRQVATAAARRYELAIVRTELIGRQDDASGMEWRTGHEHGASELHTPALRGPSPFSEPLDHLALTSTAAELGVPILALATTPSPPAEESSSGGDQAGDSFDLLTETSPTRAAGLAELTLLRQARSFSKLPDEKANHARSRERASNRVPPPASSIPPSPQVPSRFVRTLHEQAPLSFPSAPPSRPASANGKAAPSGLVPARPASARMGDLVQSPRSARLADHRHAHLTETVINNLENAVKRMGLN